PPPCSFSFPYTTLFRSVQGDLLDPRDLHDRIVVKLSHEFFNYFVFVVIMQFRHRTTPNYLIVSLLDLKKRTFLPSSNLKPTRSALPVAALKIATLET